MTNPTAKQFLAKTVSKKLNPFDGRKAQRFTHEVGFYGNDPMNFHLTKSKRALASKIFNGTDQQIRTKRKNNTVFKNMGRYVQNQLSYSPNQLYTGKYVPFPQTSIHSLAMNNSYSLMNVCDFFVVSSYQSADKHILSNIKKSCQNAKVSFLVLKPVILQACLWKMFAGTKEQSLDEFWTGAHWETYSDSLFDKLNPQEINSKQVGVYFFSLNSTSFSNIDFIFSAENLYTQSLIGAHFLPKIVEGPERLRTTLKNISTPWKYEGDLKTMEFAKVLKELALKGLVKSSPTLNGGLTVVSDSG